MKTIFTLLLSMVMFTAAFAQYGPNGKWNKDKSDDAYGSNDNRGYDPYSKGAYDHHKGGYGSYFFTPRERDIEIDRINREYRYRIESVRNKPFMGWFQKKRIINNLEAERDEQIARVIYKFRSPRNKCGTYERRDRKDW